MHGNGKAQCRFDGRSVSRLLMYLLMVCRVESPPHPPTPAHVEIELPERAFAGQRIRKTNLIQVEHNTTTTTTTTAIATSTLQYMRKKFAKYNVVTA